MNNGALGRDLCVYRITPWPIRIGAPCVAIVVVAGLLSAGAAAAVPIPILLAVTWLYAAERCGLVLNSGGIESKLTRRQNRFRYAWTDIDGFELADNRAQVAVVMRLRDGSGHVLPSTRAWLWDRRNVKQILTALAQEQAAARTK